MSVNYQPTMAPMLTSLTTMLDEAIATQDWHGAHRIIVAMLAILWSMNN